MTTNDPSGMRLYSPAGERLYLNDSECRRFLEAGQRQRDDVRLLVAFLYSTGVRVSEALQVRFADMQFDEGIVAIRSLKKRGQMQIREVHIPIILSRDLQSFKADAQLATRVFPIERSTAWRWIGAVMREAGIEGSRACPKGLRHTFGVRAILAGVPLSVLQKWMGHARLETTTIYTRIIGAEERALAERTFCAEMCDNQ